MNTKTNMKMAVLLLGACSVAMPAYATVLPTLPMTASSALVGFVLESGEDASRLMMARSRPRIPGGSGCDDPGDILEHPECQVNLVRNHNNDGQGGSLGNHVDHHLQNEAHFHNENGNHFNGDSHSHNSSNGMNSTNTSGSNRSDPRIPGGSGCDDLGDILEHPECTVTIINQ